MEQVKLVRVDEVNDAVFEEVTALEGSSYPADEGASPSRMGERRKVAKEFFYVVLNDAGQVYGFVNGTCARGDKLEEQTMAMHDPEGTTLCVHSVVVKADKRRRQLATEMLRRYLNAVVSTQPQIELILLLAKENLVKFYESCGFANCGPSDVEHGKDTWYELRMRTRGYRVACFNAFANPAANFSGNAAVVCLLPFRTRTLNLESKWAFEDGSTREGVCEKWMQKLAGQMKVSETAFLRDLGQHDNVQRFELRWFTPSTEVDLCGHATHASACALWSEASGLLRDHWKNINKFVFETRSGELFAERSADGQVVLNFPVDETFRELTNDEKETVASALKINTSQIVTAGNNKMDVMVVVDSDCLVKGLEPDLSALSRIKTRGVCVTARGSDVDLVSRFFGPQSGIDEDPFTGSAHCYLAPYWSKVLDGKTTLTAFQASKPTGFATLHLDGKGRIKLEGSGKLSWRGEVEECGPCSKD